MTAKSDRVARLLEDPDLKQAFTDVRDALHQAFANTPTDDAEALVNIRKYLHLIDSVEANLIRAIEDGHLEDFRAEQDGQNKDVYNGRSQNDG